MPGAPATTQELDRRVRKVCALLNRANNILIALLLPTIAALAVWRAAPSIIARITQ